MPTRGRRATGVEYVYNARVRPETSDTTSTRRIALATKLVVVSAGTFGSPAILERSGIGRGDVLAKHNIEQIVDLPGVGENYNGAPIIYRCIASFAHLGRRPLAHLRAIPG